MKKGDLYIGLVAIIIMMIIGIGYKLYLSNIGNERYVNVYIDRKLVHSVKLTNSVDKKITINNDYGYNLIYIHDNGVEVIDADCPNKDDVRQGFVRMPGVPIICLPHHLKVVIEGENSVSDFDAIT
ncbi:NusG domain II-containing protein [Mycoplasmatota bacterium]|nr:NusG domain II-containing protein [Mycoplasmatota bacterium]